MTQVDGPVSIREQQRALTRRRFLEVGQQLFADRGYPETTVDDIARAAGASRATFYLHFKSKSELIATLVDSWEPYGVESYHLLDGILADGGPELPGRLRAWLGGWLDLWTGGAKANHAVLQATMLDPEVERHYLRLSEALIGGLERYFERVPAAERGAARERLLILEMMTQRIFALASRSALPFPAERILDVLTDMWCQALSRNEARAG